MNKTTNEGITAARAILDKFGRTVVETNGGFVVRGDGWLSIADSELVFKAAAKVCGGDIMTAKPRTRTEERFEEWKAWKARRARG